MITGLKLRTGDTSIQYGDRILMTKRWEAYHPLAVADSGTVTRHVPNLQKMSEADLELERDCERRFASVVEHHRARDVMGGLSAFDADLVLDGWMQGEGLDHPVLGHIDVNPGDVVARVNRIMDKHASPPAWFWAEPDTEAVRVKCIAVDNAVSYNVYDGDELLGNVPDHDWNTVYVQPGSYSVRMAAYDGNDIGVRSFPVVVQVEEAEAAAMSAPSPKLTRKVASLESQVKALQKEVMAAEKEAVRARAEVVPVYIPPQVRKAEEEGPVEGEPLIEPSLPDRWERFWAFMKLGFWPW